MFLCSVLTVSASWSSQPILPSLPCSCRPLVAFSLNQWKLSLLLITMVKVSRRVSQHQIQVWNPQIHQQVSRQESLVLIHLNHLQELQVPCQLSFLLCSLLHPLPRSQPSLPLLYPLSVLQSPLQPPLLLHHLVGRKWEDFIAEFIMSSIVY